jgi:O-antigen/teichoic acid export membrane protein
VIRELWREGAIYAAGTVVSRGLALLLMPLVTRLLAPAEYGVFDLVVTAGVLVNLELPLETPQALARFWNEREVGAAQRRLAGTAWTFGVLGYGGFVALAFAAAPWLAPRVFGEGFVEACRAGAVFIGANGVMLLLQSQFRWERRPKAYARAAIAYGALTLGLLALPAERVGHALWAATHGLIALHRAGKLRHGLDFEAVLQDVGDVLAFGFLRRGEG